MPRLAATLLLVTMLSLLLTAPARASTRGQAPPRPGPRTRASVPSEEEQARTVETLTARVEVLERQAQASVQAEQAAAHRAVVAINLLLTLVVVVGVLLAFFGSRGVRDIRRMARRIQATREQADQEVRDLPQVDITQDIAPELARTLADLAQRLDSLEEFGQPLEASDCIARGNAWYAEGDYERAANWYGRAIISEPALADAHYRKAIALRRLGRSQEALSALERVIQLDPGNPEPLHVAGLVLHQLGRYEEAAAAYTKALALSPQWARSYLSRAAAYAHLRKMEQSLADLARAIELDPDARDAAVASPDFAGLRGDDGFRALTRGAAPTRGRPTAGS